MLLLLLVVVVAAAAGSSSRPTPTHHHHDYDVYILATPLDNSIGRATAEALVQRLVADSTRAKGTEDHDAAAAGAKNNNNSTSTTTRVVCLVRSPYRGQQQQEPPGIHPTFAGAGEAGAPRRWWRVFARLPRRSRRIGTTSGYRDNGLWVVRLSSIAARTSRGQRRRRRPPPESSLSPPPPPPVLVEEFYNDPVSPSFRESGERCVDQILRRVAAAHRHCYRREGAATVHLRGLFLNPYGCPPTTTTTNNRGLPTTALDIHRRRRPGENEEEEVEEGDNGGAVTLLPTPLATYKLLSVAVFADAALRRRTTAVAATDDQRGGGGFPARPEQTETKTKPLRVVLVGTEAARGLPRMGIPVPDLEDATAESVRRILFCGSDNDDNEETAARQRQQQQQQQQQWEIDYATMNALSVLYLKGLAETIREEDDEDNRGGGDPYFGVVSPGMTPESFRIEHVPGYARTIRFRRKLWMCRQPLVFGWLRRNEIAKTTAAAGDLLATALRNDPLFPEKNNANATTTNNNNTAPLRWDDVYPSGSFVGARSGTGGPLCEQSLLVYNATRGTVCLPTGGGAPLDPPITKTTTTTTTTTTKTTTNFLGDRRLQRVVYRVVRGILSSGVSDSDSNGPTDGR